MKHCYKQKFKISSFDLNPESRVRLTSLANFFQEVAYQHAGRLGFGYHDLKSLDTFWVLSRMRIRVERYPKWDEEIEVETWPNGAEKVLAIREFRVKDSNNKTIAIASTGWLVVNSTTRRPVRVTELYSQFMDNVESLFDEPLEKIVLPETMKLSENRAVRYSDLDIVGHVNNVKYIEWSLDQLSQDDLKTNPPKDIEINFMNESRAGDRVEITISREKEGAIFIAGSRLSDSKEIYRSKIQKS